MKRLEKIVSYVSYLPASSKKKEEIICNMVMYLRNIINPANPDPSDKKAR
jgi:hypothetical protein